MHIYKAVLIYYYYYSLKMFRSVIIVLIFATIFIEACPSIKKRSQWGGRNAKSKTHIGGNLPYVVIHHTETPQCATEDACAKRVKSIQDYHMDTRGWEDIGYNYLIDQFGNIYEGRGWGYQGAHAPNYNSKSIGISVIGSYGDSVPSDKALEAIKKLIECGVEYNKLKADYKLVGHRQVRQTDCPGNAFYAKIKTWPHWTNI